MAQTNEQEEKKEAEKPADSASEQDKGSVDKATSMLDQANLARKELPEYLARLEEIKKDIEKAASVVALGGKTDNAGEPEKKEETPAEYAKRILGG